MADVILNPGGGAISKLVNFGTISGSVVFDLDFSAVGSVTGNISTASASTHSVSADMDAIRLKTNMANSFTLAGVSFDAGGKHYMVKTSGDVQVDLSPTSGVGTSVGTMTPGIGQVELTAWPTNASPAVTNFRGGASAPVNGPFTPFAGASALFRSASAPLRPGSVSILGTMQDGTTFNVAADADGIVNATRVKGRVNYTTGVIDLFFVSPTAPVGTTPVDLSFLGISGLTTAFSDLVRIETLRYNAVAFSYLPLDADLIGIDPVRLPTDGRVPIFRKGTVAVLGHSANTTPATATNGGTVDCGRERLARVRVIGNDGATISSGYSVNLESGIVTWTNVTGFSQPVHVEHRIEDTLLLNDAQIDGTMTATRPITHDYPVGSYISSAFPSQNLKARVSTLFDQATWDGVTWSDALVGSAATATYNDTLAPIEVTNAGASTERFILRFTSTTGFQVIGEHVGVIGTGNINSDTAINNPATGDPYFTIREAGFGSGWSVGNIIRINTVGALKGIWLARTVQQGPATVLDDKFKLLVRGDVDRP